MTEPLRWAFVAALSLTTTLLVALLAQVRPHERPKYGHRGAERTRALEAGGLFVWFEPAIRFIAALLVPLPLERLRARQERELRRADDVLGLSADELSALAVASAVLLGVSVSVIARAADASLALPIGATGFGLVLPLLQVREIIRKRAKAVTRALPPAIEIAAMCMGAGLDFPGALRMLAEPNAVKPSPLGREFAVILEHLEFGHTRKVALESFAERVPSPAVRDFVNAVIQAEQKGNPLSRVLQIQGRMLNLRRSVAAEEAAARAGVLMVLPMVLLVGAILLLLMGPFMVKGIGW
ncbi:MAG: type II secretion system F family protein [Polyangiaceae bacterium]